MGWPNGFRLKLILQSENETPGNAIFIDDRKENTEAAESLGIRGIHFIDTEQLKSELKQFL